MKMIAKSKLYFVLLTVFCLFKTVWAANIEVPADYQTIQSAIDAAANGSTILVQPGRYVENINFKGKSITLASLLLTEANASHVSNTIIDGNQEGAVVTFNNEESRQSRLYGFTITNGLSQDGGGIYCARKCQPTLENLIVTGNEAQQFGGGIYLGVAADALIRQTLIANNVAGRDWGNGNGGGIGGTGVYLKAVIEQCTIVDNTA